MSKSVVEYTTDKIPEGAIPIRAIEIVMFIGEDGHEACSVRIQSAGNSNAVIEYGMLEFAKRVVENKQCDCED